MAPRPNDYDSEYEDPEIKRQQQAAAQPTPAAPNTPPAQQRQAPGDFVNFSRRFNANRDTARASAAKYGQQVQGTAESASNALKQAQTAFAAGVNTGTVQGPGGAPSTNTGAAAPPPAAAAPAPPQAPPAPAGPAPDPAAVEAWNNYDMGKGARPSGADPRIQAAPGTSAGALSGESTRTPESAGPSLADMLAKAGQQYSGPAEIDDKDGSLAMGAEKAQQQLNLLHSDKAAGKTAEDNLGTLINESGPSGSHGADNLSAALVGQAGRGNFDALRAKFNPNKDLLDAQAAAIKQAGDAKDLSEKNAGEWGKLAAAKGASEEEMRGINEKNDAQAKAGRDQAAEFDAAEKALPPPTNLGGQTWKDMAPAEQQKFVATIIKGVTHLSGYGHTGSASSPVDLDAAEVTRILGELTPEEYSRVMPNGNTSEAKDAARARYFMARHDRDVANGSTNPNAKSEHSGSSSVGTARNY